MSVVERRTRLMFFLAIAVLMLILVLTNNSSILPSNLLSRRTLVCACNLTSCHHPTLTPAQRRLSMRDEHCNIFTKDEPFEFENGTLTYSGGEAVIYVHNMTDVISQELVINKTWEGHHLNGLETVFNIDPFVNLIDVGCNLGVYTLLSAIRGRKAVAVDANIKNVRRLRKSLVVNKVEKNVRIVYNAISDRHTAFSIKTPTLTNIGDTFLVNKTSNDSLPVRSIKMDDLLEVIDFNRAIMKIDIQGHEFEGFHQADKLFTEVDIPIVLLEWVLFRDMKDSSRAKFIIAFFTRHRYKPYPGILSDKPLNKSDFKKWPYDVIWKRDI